MRYLIFLFIPLLFLACRPDSPMEGKLTKLTWPEKLTYPDWAKDANIYEVNTRQYTKEGTFQAFMAHLPRLKEMRVEILWLMPIHPIGKKKREGSLGNPYSVANYKKINPDFGSRDDLKMLVDSVHRMGMKVILDWVPSKSALDNPWVRKHPDWYLDQAKTKQDSTKREDVIELNYENQAMRAAMIDAMEYWVTEFHIDGFRCEDASAVPTDFWLAAREHLHQYKQLFMLADSEDPELTTSKAFDAHTSTELYELINKVSIHEAPMSVLDDYFARREKQYSERAIHLNYISGHDENYKDGSEAERMGYATKPMEVLCATLPGTHLIYSGQEAQLDYRLNPFEKDTIHWKESSYQNTYTTLNILKQNNPALWNGEFGGTFEKLTDQDDEWVYGFLRERGKYQVAVFINFSKYPVNIISRKNVNGMYYVLGRRDIQATEVLVQPYSFNVLRKD